MKRFYYLLVVLLALFLSTGCTYYRSVTYNLDNGDEIEVKLVTNDGYSINTKLPFVISKDEKVLSQGAFLTLEEYEQCKEIINTNEEVKVIEKKGKVFEYIFYNYNGQYNYLMKMPYSQTAILIKNEVSEESAREVFKRLTFTIKK